MNLKTFLSALCLLAGIAMATDADSATNKQQCNNVPSNLFADCRKAVAANKPFFYSYIKTPEGCKSISDSASREACLSDVFSGKRHAIRTDSYQPESLDPVQPALSREDRQAVQLERIANATERTALLSTIQLALMAASVALVVVLTVFK